MVLSPDAFYFGSQRMDPADITREETDEYFREVNGGADKKLRQVYTKIDSADKYQANYYDVSHSMTIPMQEDAFDWLEKWLKYVGGNDKNAL